MQKAVKSHYYLGISIEAAFLFLACLLWPFYFFESGTPQVFVIFLLLFCIVVIGSKRIYLWQLQQLKNFTYLLVGFLLYTLLVNGYHAISSDSLKPLVYSTYFLLSFGVAITFSACLLIKPEILHALYLGIAASLALQAALLLPDYTELCTRQKLFFNNPNQLAFYSLLSLSLLIYLYSKLKKNAVLFGVAVFSSMILTLSTHSRGAVLSSVLLILLQFVFGDRLVKKLLAIIVTILMIAFLAANGLNLSIVQCKSSTALEKSVGRLSSLTRGVEARVKKRGYDRIIDYPEYLIFGAGEGGARNFARPGEKKIELHSFLGTLVFSYGVVGFCFAAVLLYLLVRQGGAEVVLYLLPLMAYSMVHNTLRQPFLWLFIALLCFALVSRRPVEPTHKLPQPKIRG